MYRCVTFKCAYSVELVWGGLMHGNWGLRCTCEGGVEVNKAVEEKMRIHCSVLVQEDNKRNFDRNGVKADQ